MAVYKKERLLDGKKFFSVASGGGTGRTLHPDNMARSGFLRHDRHHGPDALRRTVCRFVLVPAHVEMMGLIGMGNNPMVAHRLRSRSRSKTR